MKNLIIEPSVFFVMIILATIPSLSYSITIDDSYLSVFHTVILFGAFLLYKIYDDKSYNIT